MSRLRTHRLDHETVKSLAHCSLNTRHCGPCQGPHCHQTLPSHQKDCIVFVTASLHSQTRSLLSPPSLSILQGSKTVLPLPNNLFNLNPRKPGFQHLTSKDAEDRVKIPQGSAWGCANSVNAPACNKESLYSSDG